MPVEYENYKPIRNAIRKLDKAGALLYSIQQLHRIAKVKPSHWNGFLPWNLLLLIKWIFVEFNNLSGKARPFERVKLHRILDKINNLGNDNPFLGNGPKQDIRKFAHQLAFQQFLHQRDFSKMSIVRQSILFNGKHLDFDFNREFESVTGISIRDYLGISFLLWAYFCQEKSTLHFRWNDFARVEKMYMQDKILPLVLRWTLNLDQAAEFAHEKFQAVELSHQIYEQTPFVQFPFLFFDEKIFCYSPKLLEVKMEDYVYDELKRSHGQNFCQSFGFAFESYIDSLLQKIKMTYLSENDIRKIVGSKGKAVDFWVKSLEGNVFIEAKSIEMPSLAKVDPTAEILQSRLGQNALKAVVQMYATIHRIPVDALSNKKNFGLIISYKQLYLGNVKRFWNEFLEDHVISELKGIPLRSDLLPPENIFFVSIEEFEVLTDIVKVDSQYLDKVFSEAVESLKNPETSKFLISQHFDLKIGAGSEIDESLEIFDEITNELIDKLGIHSK